MKLRTIIAYICTILLAIQASGSPARRGPIALTQPDGTTFTALISGDESARIKTTLEGCAIMQNEDLWWCYATYDSEGNKYCTEWHVGSQAPASVISSSRSIPRAEIAASAKRSSAGLTLMNSTISDTAPSERTVNSGIVILAQFKDIQFLHSKEEFEAMLMSEGYDRHGATGSAREYFEAQFGGRLDFTFDVSDIVTLPGKREYYGSNDSKGNDIRPAEMIADACQLAAEIGNVKFSNYDNNNDGKVDNVFVFFAGEDEAEGADETSIWSHSWHLFRGAGLTLELDGKMIDRYACTAEMTRIYDHSSGKLLDTRICGIGTFCHEYCHTFGLPDMYDTDYDNLGGWSAGLWGHTSIMDSGNQNNEGNTPPNFNAIEREILGLSEPAVIETDGRYTLTPVQTSGAVYRLNAEQEGEYYLFECRSDKNDIWDKHIGGSGMLVYHIDKTPSAISRWEGLNTVNTDAGHQCADLIEADGRSDTFADYWDYMAKRDNIGGIFFPYSSTSNILAHGKPGLNFWSGDAGDLSVTEIQKEDDGRITFNVIGFTAESTPPAVLGSIQYEAFCDGVIVRFETDREYSGEAVICYGTPGNETSEVIVQPYEEGKYALLIEGLDPVTTYTVSAHFVLNEIKGKTTRISFMTKKKPSVTWPYMNFGTVSRESDGSYAKGSRIPLKVNNSKGIFSIMWKFDGKPINHDGDYYYTLDRSGSLEAHIFMEDGSEEILVKNLTVSEGGAL